MSFFFKKFHFVFKLKFSHAPPSHILLAQDLLKNWNETRKILENVSSRETERQFFC